MSFNKKNYIDITGLSTFKSNLLSTVINDLNKTNTSKTATIKAIADYVDSEVSDLSSAVTLALAGKVSSVTYDSTNKKLVYNKDGSTNTDIVSISTIKSDIGNFIKSGTNASSGLVPAPSTTAGSSKYLREDGTWANPVALDEGTVDISRFVIFQDSTNNTTTLTPCYYKDFKYNPVTNTLTAGTFSGNLSGTATKATQDASGNTITSTYATKTELSTALGNVESLLAAI